MPVGAHINATAPRYECLMQKSQAKRSANRCRCEPRRVMAGRSGLRVWDRLVREPAAELRPRRTEPRPERACDALGPKYRRAWKPPNFATTIRDN